MTRSGSIPYVRAFDGLRAFAVVLVLTAHTEIEGLGGAGPVGVDIFFVLSGWLITSILLRTLDSGAGFSLRSFYLNRLIRLWPALLTAIALMTVPAFLVIDDRRMLAVGTLASALYLFPAVGWSMPWLGVWDHTWTLALEEWFYLLFPPLLIAMFAFRWSRVQAAMTLALGACLALGTSAVAYAVLDNPSGLFSYLQVGALAAGCACALLFDGKPPATAYRRRVMEWSGLALVLVAAAMPAVSDRITGLAFLVATLGGVLLVLGLSGPTAGAIGSVFRKSGPGWVGRISYEIYLFHQPLVTLAAVGSGIGFAYGALIAYPLAVALAFAVHQFWLPKQREWRARLEMGSTDSNLTRSAAR